MTVIEKAIQWLKEDMAKPQPYLSHTIFSMKELNAAANLEIEDLRLEEFGRVLQNEGIVVVTDKISETGNYYNVNANIFLALHTHHDIEKWMQNNMHRKSFCLTITPKKIYPLVCTGRKCRFYLRTEKVCIQDKFFL